MSEKDKKANKTSIGGQAVLEGVMMRGKKSMATAVRTESGEILLETVRLTPPEKQNKFLRLPFIRGSVNLVSSMITGKSIRTRTTPEEFKEGFPLGKTSISEWHSNQWPHF